MNTARWGTASATVALAAVSFAGSGPARAQPPATAHPQATRIVPTDTVVRARLEERLSTRTATRGQHFTATVDDNDRSGFPDGTRLEGVVTEVEHPTKEHPGVLDVQFRRAILPGGRAVAITGRLASLDEKDVKETTDGRLVAAHRGDGKMQTKWLGYGAAGGAVLSTIFGGNFLKGALLGALGGGAYAYLNKAKNHERYREVDLDPDTRFGVRITHQVAFANVPSYHYRTFDRDRDRQDYRDDRDRDHDRDTDRDRDRDRDRDHEDRDRD